jgi:catechol 2,3-dioxygenase-like lactoylglutathione lyase family enzyme
MIEYRFLGNHQDNKMQLKHIALVSSTQDKADRFYQTVLGLKKTNEKILAAALSDQIFNFDAELKIINYANDTIHFEIFIAEKQNLETNTISHVCLEIDNLEAFLDTCRKMGVAILQVPKGDAMITFITDDDGNRFEIKHVD